MNNFIFENSSKVYFGEGCEKNIFQIFFQLTATQLCFTTAVARLRKMAFMTRL